MFAVAWPTVVTVSKVAAPSICSGVPLLPIPLVAPVTDALRFKVGASNETDVPVWLMAPPAFAASVMALAIISWPPSAILPDALKLNLVEAPDGPAPLKLTGEPLVIATLPPVELAFNDNGVDGVVIELCMPSGVTLPMLPVPAVAVAVTLGLNTTIPAVFMLPDDDCKVTLVLANTGAFIWMLALPCAVNDTTGAVIVPAIVSAPADAVNV